ncbi:extracellular solute-binding protein [Halocatena pleomorpha]|uniref:Extracellular solute-binding protein n=1 Tax=Halocatena pleomorpha TaxID=1785090 RepID=A0A3P3R2X1_9EURY|nr:extracellular solute-binding protein [Halocatena pleomorpha]RRJ27674.1 extracellular solute-binding protein [Halocatena pleomorpha]
MSQILSMPADTTPIDSRQRISRRQLLGSIGASSVTVCLAGCIYRDEGGGGNTITFGFDPVQVRQNGDQIKQLFHEQGLSDDITIEFVEGSQDSSERRQSYTQLLQSDQADPDLFLMDCGWTIPFIVGGNLLNLTAELSDNLLSTIENDYFSASVETAKDPDSGDLYGVPLFPDFSTIQYRKDLVTEAGYDPDGQGWATTPMTWKRFSTIAQDVRDTTDADHGFVFQFDTYEGLSCCTFNEFMSSWGGAYFGGREHLFGPIGNRPITVDAEPVVTAVDMVRQFIHGGTDNEALSGYRGSIAPSGVLSWKEQDTLRAMESGTAVFMRNWPYTIASLAAEDAFGTDYGVMPLPYAVSPGNAQATGTGGSTSALGGWHITVNANTNRTEMALELIEVAMKDDFQLGLLGITGWMPPKPALYDTRAATKQEPVGRYMETLQIAGTNAMPRPSTPVWPQQATTIYQQVNAAAATDKPTTNAMTELKDKLRSIENEVT